jgi:hypothetical protein
MCGGVRAPPLVLLLFCLLAFPARLLPVPLAGERLFYALLLTRLQIEGVTFDFLNNVLLLNLPLEAAEGVFQSFALLKPDFSQI